MDKIFFEKFGNLCAQHALNALLQSAMFTPQDLAAIAQRLDNQEQSVLSTHGSSAASGQSHNMDDSGFFSVQVVAEALSLFGLELVPYKSTTDPSAIAAQQEPVFQNAYICNMREHWFTIRKIGFQWFNLNSMFKGPELVSDTHLHLLLAQILNDGYDIFVVKGDLPHSEADECFRLHPIEPEAARCFTEERSRNSISSPSHSVDNDLDDEDSQLARALALSWQTADIDDVKNVMDSSRQELDAEDPSYQSTLYQSLRDREEEELQRALAMSLSDAGETSQAFTAGTTSFYNGNCASSSVDGRDKQSESVTVTKRNSEVPSVADLRDKRAAFLDRLEKQKGSLPEQEKGNADS